jgi:hypothetical protein
MKSPNEVLVLAVEGRDLVLLYANDSISIGYPSNLTTSARNTIHQPVRSERNRGCSSGHKVVWTGRPRGAMQSHLSVHSGETLGIAIQEHIAF